MFCDGHRLRVADFARGEEAWPPYWPKHRRPARARHRPARHRHGRHRPGRTGARGRPPTPQADAPLRALAHEAVLQAITRHGGNKKQAAHALGIPRSHLYQIPGAASAPEAAAARRRGPPRQSATASSGSRIATRRRRPSAASPASAADKCRHSAAGASATKPSLA